MGKIRPNMHEICMKIKKSGTKLEKKKSAKNLGRQKNKSVKKIGNRLKFSTLRENFIFTILYHFEFLILPYWPF